MAPASSTRKQARERREEIARQADFYGAMDGASKFVKGDAIAGLLITAINIVGGIFIGVVQRGMPFRQAAATYTILTVGDGLVTQIPALIVSAPRPASWSPHAGDGSRHGHVLATQLGAHPRAMYIAAGVLGVLRAHPRASRCCRSSCSPATFAALGRMARTRATAEAVVEERRTVTPRRARRTSESDR